MIRKGIFIVLFGLFCSLVNAQTERKFVRKGNDSYEQKNYTDSEIKYRKALDQKSDYYDALYNLGDALYKQEKYKEAAKQFQAIANQSEVSEDLKAKAYHNMGNSLLKSKKLKESINAYKNALKLNPKDIETKHNLSYAMNQLQKQKKQQKKNQQNKNQQNNQNKDNKNKNKKQDQKKDNQQQNNQQQQQQKKDQQKKQKQQKNQPKQQQKKISKEDAKRLLQALENDEKKLQKKLKKKKAKSKKVKVTKDW